MTNSAVPVPRLELMIYIRKRPKEKGLLETKHEFKIFEACVSGADTITMCPFELRRFSKFGVQISVQIFGK